MTKDEALKQGVEALENIDRWLPTIGQKGLRDYEADALAAMKEALAQPAQEPVAWCIKYGGVLLYAEGSLSKKEVEGNFARNFNEGLSEIIPLYTAPPQRPWVGLTDEERQDIALEVPMDAVFITEAKLKEKNNGT